MFTTTVCVCGVCVVVCLCECVREGDKDSLVFSERSRIPCCPKYSETLLFSSVHLLNASWTGGDRGCLLRVITKVAGGGGGELCTLSTGSNESPSICICLRREGTFIPSQSTKKRAQRPGLTQF